MGSREQDQEETCKCRVQSEEEAGTDAGRLKGRMPGIDRGWGWQKERERIGMDRMTGIERRTKRDRNGKRDGNLRKRQSVIALH